MKIIMMPVSDPRKRKYAYHFFYFTSLNQVSLQVLKADPSVPELMYIAEDKLCHCFLKLDQQQEALPFCSAALGRHQEPRILCDRAEVYIALDMLDEAQQDYAKVKLKQI